MNKATSLPVFATILIVLFLTTGTTVADMVVGTAVSSWGTAKVERDGSEIPFTDGMELRHGDKIKTERNSGAIYELLDRFGDPIVREEIFGLPGAKGCADAEGERGRGLIELRRREIGTDKRRIISIVRKGTIRSRTKSGKENESKLQEFLGKRGVAKKKGTELAISYDLGSDQTSLSVLSGWVEFDNVDYDSLPDMYFTDPMNKSDETLNFGVLLSFTSETVGISELLGAGNDVNVVTDYYSIVSSPPSTPLPGKAPIHDAPGGLSPEPGTLALLAMGAVGLLRRRHS